jgi:hypothetical protein
LIAAPGEEIGTAAIKARVICVFKQRQFIAKLFPSLILIKSRELHALLLTTIYKMSGTWKFS